MLPYSSLVCLKGVSIAHQCFFTSYIMHNCIFYNSENEIPINRASSDLHLTISWKMAAELSPLCWEITRYAQRIILSIRSLNGSPASPWSPILQSHFEHLLPSCQVHNASKPASNLAINNRYIDYGTRLWKCVIDEEFYVQVLFLNI